MFIQKFPKELPTGYRKTMAEFIRQGGFMHMLMQNWGADTLPGFAAASGLPLEKLRGLPSRELKVAAAIWVESVLWEDLGEPAHLAAYRTALKKYGVPYF